jgi:hypothetical protein
MRPDPSVFLPHDPTRRTEFRSNYCQTTAYPSDGGLVIGLFTAVELRQLGLSNLKPSNRSQKPGEEDSLAMRMMRLGAHWWPSWDFYARHKIRINDLNLYDFHFPPRLNVGYPSSGEGVWVFKFSEDQQTWEEEDDRKPYLPLMPDGWDARIHMALTMDERCELLKEFGATFYENKDGCEDLPSSLEEGVQRGRRYKVLLDKMDDPYYVDNWLSGDGQNTNS